MRALLLLFLSISLAGQTPIQSFYLDFGPNDGANGNTTASPNANGVHWNNPSSGSTTAPAIVLVNQDGIVTTRSVVVTNSFSTNGINHGGLLEPTSELLGEFAIATATQDYFFTSNSSALTFSGLDPSRGYKFTLFASRNNSQVRVSGYRFTGVNEVIGSLQSSGPELGGSGYDGNNSTTYSSELIFPTATGEILLTLTRNEGSFGYINLLKLEEFDDSAQINVNTITVTGADIEEQGDTRQMLAATEPADATFQGVSWSVDDPTVAEVTSGGVLIPLRNGTVTVTATTVEPGSTVSGSKTVTITGQAISHFFIDFGDATAITLSPDQNDNHWTNATDPASTAAALEVGTSEFTLETYEMVINKSTAIGGLPEE
ncbi:MAG: Ig-like domain-containing protein, partial [Bacteroidota bacterium]